MVIIQARSCGCKTLHQRVILSHLRKMTIRGAMCAPNRYLKAYHLPDLGPELPNIASLWLTIEGWLSSLIGCLDVMWWCAASGILEVLLQRRMWSHLLGRPIQGVLCIRSAAFVKYGWPGGFVTEARQICAG